MQKVVGRSSEARSKKAQKHTAESHQLELVGNQGLNPFVSGSFKENTVLRKEYIQRKRNVKTGKVNRRKETYILPTE